MPIRIPLVRDSSTNLPSDLRSGDTISFSIIGNLPTTLSGYGITDPVALLTGSNFTGPISVTDDLVIQSSSTNSTYISLRNSVTGAHGYSFFSSGGGPAPVGSFGIYDETVGAARLLIDTTGSFKPGNDNSQSCGDASHRWSVVYAATGSINTSDERDKTPVVQLSDAELSAASDISRAIGSYQWLESIAKKGSDKARHHVGITVQEAISIMRSHGLDPMNYGFICHDSWDETQEVVISWPAKDAVTDDDGNIIEPSIKAGSKIMQPYMSAGDKYSFRHDELLLFIARGFASRLDSLEAK